MISRTRICNYILVDVQQKRATVHQRIRINSESIISSLPSKLLCTDKGMFEDDETKERES